MKSYFVIIMLLVVGAVAFSKPNYSDSSSGIYRTDPLQQYTGKYKKNYDATTVIYIRVSLVNGALTLTSLWDNHTINLKPLSGDNFIASGPDWAVKFIRDKDKNVIQVLVRGTDLWTKVKP